LVQRCPDCNEENPDRFRLCGYCGALLSPVASEEVRKTVTVVFSDLKDSTSLGEKLDSESLREVLSVYFSAMRQVLERHGGTSRNTSATPSWPCSASRGCTRTTRCAQ
jgi:class 3 adenylate cyclase